MFFEERVSWIINFIKERDGLNNIQLGQSLGVNKNTIQAYSKGKGELKGAALAAIAKNFGINGEWLIAGNGEPFPGAREKYPEACGPEKEPIVSSIPRATARSDAPVVDAQAFQIDLGEDVRLAIEVLSSGTHYASSLQMNIRSFAAAVADNRRLTVLEQKMLDMDAKMDRLINQNKALQAEVNRLKATYEDPDGGSGSLTNTSGND